MTKNAEMTKRKRIRGTTSDDTLAYATTVDPNLEQWRILAAEWLGTLREGKGRAMQTLKIFLVDYIHGQRLETDPAKFLRSGYRAPCLYETGLSHFKTRHEVGIIFAFISRFINYVLTHYYSVEDDHGIRIVSSEFRSPIPALPEAVGGHAGPNQESDKNVLPYHFIGQLRSLLCPAEATSFADWKWAQAVDVKNGGSWFVVPFELIDKTDPDCVWRLRETSAYERKKHGYCDVVHELWSPVLAVALYVKLQLPLRTYQVRMLDSGEADTARYVRGKWVKNTGPWQRARENIPST
ncbi:MAG: integrase family protein, partial [Burkholderiales bacterium]|nr:integrase family protein [Burkholderiales bacterium]